MNESPVVESRDKNHFKIDTLYHKHNYNTNKSTFTQTRHKLPRTPKRILIMLLFVRLLLIHPKLINIVNKNINFRFY